MKPKYNTLLQAIIATVVITITLILCEFLFLVLPLFFDNEPTANYFSLAFVIASLLYIPIIIYFAKKWDISVKEFFIKLPKWYEIVTIFIVVPTSVIATLLVIDSVEDIMSLYNGEVNQLYFKSFEIKPYISLIRATIIAPITEEIFFRGLILVFLLKKFSPFKAIIISSLLFSIAHLRFDDFISLFFYGIVFALIFYKTGSLYMSIIAHFLTNLILSFIDVEKINLMNMNGVHLILFVIGFVFIVATIYMLNNLTKKLE